MNVLSLGVPYFPAAYFILGESTARWFFDAYLFHSDKVILSHCLYAKMIGHKIIALDYEDPRRRFDPTLATKVKRDTVITPSNLYEKAKDPLALARDCYAAIFGTR